MIQKIDQDTPQVKYENTAKKTQASLVKRVPSILVQRHTDSTDEVIFSQDEEHPFLLKEMFID